MAAINNTAPSTPLIVSRFAYGSPTPMSVVADSPQAWATICAERHCKEADNQVDAGGCMNREAKDSDKDRSPELATANTDKSGCDPREQTSE
jgi:hypothetical protein